LAITHLHNVQKDIWSPSYGVNGNLGATVQVCIISPSPPPDSHTPHLICQRSIQSTETQTGRTIVASSQRPDAALHAVRIRRIRYTDPLGLIYYTQNEGAVRVPMGINCRSTGVRDLLAGYIVYRRRDTKVKVAMEKSRKLRKNPSYRLHLVTRECV
jgi:DNA replication ATP-dependent helicase Dna2